MGSYFLEEVEENKLRSRKHKMVCTTLFVSVINECISISDFAYLYGIPIGVTNSTSAIAAAIKMYKPIIKKNKKKKYKTVLFAKSK